MGVLDVSYTDRQQLWHRDVRVPPDKYLVGAADLAASKLATCGEADLAAAQAIVILLFKRTSTVANASARQRCTYRSGTGSCLKDIVVSHRIKLRTPSR